MIRSIQQSQCFIFYLCFNDIKIRQLSTSIVSMLLFKYIPSLTKTHNSSLIAKYAKLKCFTELTYNTDHAHTNNLKNYHLCLEVDFFLLSLYASISQYQIPLHLQSKLSAIFLLQHLYIKNAVSNLLLQ